MISINDICCVCLGKRETLEKLLMTQENLSHYDKLVTLIPEMNINEIKEMAFICKDCIDCTDNMYEFRITCLNNNVTLQTYITQLRFDKMDDETTTLSLIKEEMEINDLNHYESEHINVNGQRYLQSENNLITKDIGNCTENHLKIEESCDIIDTFKTEMENVSENDIKTISQINVDFVSEPVETVTNMKDPLECNATSELNQNKTFDISLHTEIDIKIKNERCEDDMNDEYQLENISENYDYNSKIEENTNFGSELIVDIKNEPSETNTEVMNLSDDRIHSREDFLENKEKFKCEICMKVFTDNNCLKKHGRVHTGDKPHKCEICNKAFKYSCSLKKHFRFHTGEKPYKCEKCNKSFIESSHLTKHKRIHTGEKPFNCDVCNKSFNESSSLTRHHRIHTGEKPFICEICKKSFIDSTSLKKHVRIHTGEKPYKCKKCSKSFIQSSHLAKHNKVHISEKT